MLYCPEDGSYTSAEEYTWPCEVPSVVVAGLANLGGAAVFGAGEGLEEMMLLSCWNLWNSVSKSMFGLLEPVATVAGVEDT